MGRKISFILFVSLSSALLLPASALSFDSTFKDVPAESWYAKPVAWAVEVGVTGGTTATTFSPQNTCSNAQVLTFLWRACGSPETRISNPFRDVSKESYYYWAALWAYENGMADGGSFQPDKPCSRSMAMVYLWEEAGAPEPTIPLAFEDVSADAEYADAVAWGVEMGITSGTAADTFSPAATCTRAQIITFLYRDLVETPREEAGSLQIGS